MALLAVLTSQASWELQLSAAPRSEPLLINSGASGQMLLIPLGNAGLGAWTQGGVPVPGFPAMSGEGVFLRPAGVPIETGETMIAFSDEEGSVHLIYQNGAEASGWPVEHSENVVTGITATDLNDDGEHEISFGTSDGFVHLLDLRGVSLPGFPVNLQSHLQFQPTEVSLGGGRGNGLICATSNSNITVLGRDGQNLPGWPQQTGYPSGTVPVSGDMNGDGQADILFASQDGKVHLYSLLGEEQEGWPFYMDARPVAGAPSVGRVDEDASTAQMAISSIDNTVYLLNGDGSLAGTWRWPNRTDTRPFQPIITYTDQGQAVITTSNSGTLYAWDGAGRILAGYPRSNPLGSIYPPVAADMDGNGSTELITVTPSGLVQATEAASRVGSICQWPQHLGNQTNSGMFTTPMLPVALVEQVSGEFTGPVTIPYTISCGAMNSLTVSYSTDAGYTWQETGNYTAGTGSIIWNTQLDLPMADERRCRIKITPHSTYGPGESGTSGLLHIDNNSAPEIHMDIPVRLDEHRFLLGYAAQDREGDTIQLQAQFSVDGGNTWDLAHLGNNSLEIEQWFYGTPVTWDSSEDIAGYDISQIILRVRAADDDPGEWFYFDQGLALDDSRLPCAQIIPPDGEVEGDVELGVRLGNAQQSGEGIIYQYSADGGSSWHNATIKGTEPANSDRLDFNLIWDSSADLPTFDGDQVLIRALPPAGGVGVSVPSAPFHVDNNRPPYCRIESPSKYDVFRGLVPVRFTLVDSEWDQIILNLQYRIHDVEENWHTAQGLVNTNLIDASMYNTLLNWNSSTDLPGANTMDLDIRLMAIDGDSVPSEWLGPITIHNQGLPEILRAAISNMDKDRRRADIVFEIGDGDRRTIQLVVDFSTDGGFTWNPAGVTGNLSSLAPGSYAGSFVWNYGTDGVPGDQLTILRLTPRFEGNKLGRPRIIQQVFQ